MNKQKPAKTPKCGNCVWFDPLEELVKINGGTVIAEKGYCRINPPVVIDSGRTVFPKTTVEDWCGKWIAIEDSIEKMEKYDVTIPIADVDSVLDDFCRSYDEEENKDTANMLIEFLSDNGFVEVEHQDQS